MSLGARLSVLSFPFFLGAILLGASCTDKGAAPGGSELDLPKITNAVEGNSSGSETVGPMATTGASLNADSCASCGAGTSFSDVHWLASTFVFQGKFADYNSCMISAVSAADVVPGITSGEYVYLDVGEGKMKIKVNVADKVVTSFEIFTCSAGEMVQYLAGTNVNNDVTFKMRAIDDSFGLFFAMDGTGTLSGTNWTSKSLDITSSMTNSYSFSTVKQTADYLDVTGIIDTGTLNTLEGTDSRLVARAQLIGDSAKTYALGDGSIRRAIGGGAASSQNWNGDTAVHGAGPTTYDSAVASATLPTFPTTRVNALTAAETWDCQTTNPVDFMKAIETNSAFEAAVTACEELFQ